MEKLEEVIITELRNDNETDHRKTLTVLNKNAIRTNLKIVPSEQEIADWELEKGKRPFNGIGNLFRQYSQYLLMKKWYAKLNFKSALETPFDHATDGIDGNILTCHHDIRVNSDEVDAAGMLWEMSQIPTASYEFVWNFGFLQREPAIINEMKRISQRYIAAFVPNYVNPGTLVHMLYHSVYDDTCEHPERGDKKLMSISGLKKLFENSKLKVIEAGYVDLPPFFDTVVTVKEFFGSSSKRDVLKIPINVKSLLPFERISCPKRIMAHHCFVVAEKF